MPRDALETDLEEECVRYAEALGALALKLEIKGQRGFPDRSFFMPNGRMFFVEFKREKRNDTSVQQHHWADQLKRHKQAVYFISDFEHFRNVICGKV